jgi:hypothetical protein
MKQHPLGYILTTIGVVLGVVAFVIVLVHLPPINGVAIPVFIVVMLVVGSVFAGFLGRRARRW